MAFFRNLERVVPSSLFTKPNSLLLQSRFRPLYLQKGTEPRIEYLHTVKPLLRTIQILKNHANNSAYSGVVDSELQFLEGQLKSYADLITRFVSQGGLLTGQGIANVYFAADKLNLSAEWLQKNVHSDIPLKYKYMSKQNLADVAAGLEKYHKESPYLTQIKEELARRDNEAPVYVEHQFNESNKYEYASGNESNHPLISTISSGSSVWRYHLSEIWGRVARRGQYVLHSD